MHVLVLYESRRGYTLTVARAIRDDLRERGHRATTAAVGSIDAGTLASADALIVGTWTAGKILVGVGPPPEAVDAIRSLPNLDGRPAAVFVTYDVAPRGTLDVLAAELTARGGVVEIGERFRNGPMAKTGRRSLARVAGFLDVAIPAFERASVVR
jgi:flavodoxin